MEWLPTELRRRRVEQLELTLKDIAELMNVTAVYVSDIERGNRRPLKRSVLRKIAEAYQMDPERVLRLALASRDSVELNTRDASPEKRDVAVTLARSWDDLTETDLTEIGKVLERRSHAAG